MEFINAAAPWVLIYWTLAKAILASTDTPPTDTTLGKLYRFVEWTVLVIGKVKQEPK